MFLLAVAPVVKAQDKPADTQEKHTSHPDVDTLPVETIYLTNSTQQNDANEITTALRNMLSPWVKVYLIPTQNVILLRATPDEVAMARQVVHDLDRVHPEIVVDVTVLSVSKERLSQLGKDAADALMNDKDAHVLQRQSIRATNGRSAVLKTGSRIPVMTGVSAGKEASASGRSEFQYVDVGTNVALTPFLSGKDESEVSLKIKIELSMQSGSSVVGGVNEPVIAQRVVEQEVQLRDGEPSILDASSKDTDPNETVFLVVPHIVRPTAGQSAAAALALNGQ
jgi:general secretion pathway protein D